MKQKKNNEYYDIYNIRTDLAIESHELINKKDYNKEDMKIYIEENDLKDIKITTVEILNENGALKMGKEVGKYVTIESQTLKENNVEAHEEIIKILSKKLLSIYNLKKEDIVLIIGIGNWNVTPDSLGPKVVSKVLVTRNIKESLPANIKKHLRDVSAISPGVLGITGMETGEIVKGIVNKITPNLVIAIDALASRNINRINTTIQICNVGITPGGGMGNKRKCINKKTMGVPVISIGVPTVVDAATLVNDVLDKIIFDMLNKVEKESYFYEMLNNLEKSEKYNLIKDTLDPYVGNMFVTPKEVDSVVERLSNIIANAINISLHEGITKDDINRYIY